MTPRAVTALLALLLPLAAQAGFTRSGIHYPVTLDEAAGSAGVERIEYAGGEYAALAERLAIAFEEFRRDLGGVTFGIDAGTHRPVQLDDRVEQAVLEMIRTSPDVARKVRGEGGLLTAVFEFRPRLQPANANLYLRVSYAEKDGRFELRRIVDPPDAPEREDITGLNVEMP